MQVIIPMAGTGQRFIDSGYDKIKPLIEIENRPMIEHVIEMFPEKSEFLFICNKDHLNRTSLEKVLKKKAPNAKIIGISPHKNGPVFTVLQAEKEIRENEPVIVNYCDFKFYWDFKNFEKQLTKTNCDGAVTAYTGFHPHLLWGNKYAGMTVRNKNWLEKIKEKHCFTENPQDSFHSAGTYYFRTGKEMKKYSKILLEKKLSTNNEYYFSSVYGLLLKEKKKVFVYEVEFFLQWGTPQDLQEYIYWSKYFNGKKRNVKTRVLEKATFLMPLAGAGKRFAQAGYKTPKPLIEIGNKPMFLHSVESYPKNGSYVFVVSKKHLKWKIDQKIMQIIPSAKIVIANKPTQGQASSCMLAEQEINPDSPLIIAACDNRIIWNQEKFEKTIKDKQVKSVIWTFRNNAAVNRKPEDYAYVKIKNGNAVFVSCKKTISKSPAIDHAVTGTFYFRKAKDFFSSARQMIENNVLANNEFYADTVPNELIRNGKNVKVFEVDNYIVFGTPNDIKTHSYWQEYFRKTKNGG